MTVSASVFILLSVCFICSGWMGPKQESVQLSLKEKMAASAVGFAILLAGRVARQHYGLAGLLIVSAVGVVAGLFGLMYWMHRSRRNG